MDTAFPAVDEFGTLIDVLLAGDHAAALAETQRLIQAGHPAEKIVTTALEKHIDLIVIPTYGQRESPAEGGESVSEQVVRMAACPVMTIQAACCDEPCV